jgi:hypothetical protein
MTVLGRLSQATLDALIDILSASPAYIPGGRNPAMQMRGYVVNRDLKSNRKISEW